MTAKGYTSAALSAILSKRIRNYRIDHKLTQKQLSEASGVSLRCVQRLENSQDIQLSNLFKIMIALGMTDNILMMVPDVSHRPSEYLVKESPRKRVRPGKSKDSISYFAWGEDTGRNEK